ncbi:MICOS complex subunit MIC26-like [Apostichopus japonicus]|uniref:MICOS complex subunit MIC26-like n=1 Tax=Stichopus japonicus TaxID=307972 RepID=UPI003AB6D989
MFRVVKYATLGSAPVVSFGFMKVEAAEKSSGNKVLVRPKDLPLYSEDKLEWEVQVEERENNALEEGISVVRQQIWKLSDACQGAVDTTKTVYNKVEKTTTDVVTYIKTEEGFFPRAGVIGLAGLTGIVLARKGGIFRKLIYSGGLMSGTTALCYPYKAVQLSQAEYNWVKDRLTGLYDSQTAEQKKTPTEDVTATEEIKSDGPSSSLEEKDAALSKPDEAPSTETDKPVADKDYGQSNPADKDMYTTRS